MYANIDLLERFYTAVQRSDIAAVRTCYSPNVLYSDPVFGELRGDRAVIRWQMIFSREAPLQMSFSDLAADHTTGSGRWEARITSTRTGREVRMVIDSRFRFAGGRILEHRDTFSVYRWSKMALGPAVRLAGWTTPLRSMLQRETAAMLDRFEVSPEHGDGPEPEVGIHGANKACRP
jgi:ketosteroid isomerase-like protein